MTEYTQEEAVFRMNEMGKAGRPFLFIIDYKRERIYVERPEEIAPSELLYDLNGFTKSMPIHSRPFPGISMRVILIW